MVTRCAVLGSPIAHSLSPVLHRAAYAELGLDWTYDAVEVDEAGLPGFVAGLDASWRGLSLTMPLKRTVLPLLDEVTDTRPHGRGGQHRRDRRRPPSRRQHRRPRDRGGAGRAGRRPGRLARWSSAGAPPRPRLPLALCDLGVRAVTLAVRDAARAAETLDAVGAPPRDPSPSTSCRSPSPSATRGDGLGPAGLDDPGLGADARAGRGLVADADVVFEVLYEPWPTPLARAATDGRPRAGRGPRPAGAPGGAPGRADDRTPGPAGGDAGRGPGCPRRPLRRTASRHRGRRLDLAAIGSPQLAAPPVVPGPARLGSPGDLGRLGGATPPP